MKTDFGGLMMWALIIACVLLFPEAIVTIIVVLGGTLLVAFFWTKILKLGR